MRRSVVAMQVRARPCDAALAEPSEGDLIEERRARGCSGGNGLAGGRTKKPAPKAGSLASDFEVFSGDLEAALSHSGRSAPSPAIAHNNSNLPRTAVLRPCGWWVVRRASVNDTHADRHGDNRVDSQAWRADMLRRIADIRPRGFANSCRIGSKVPFVISWRIWL